MKYRNQIWSIPNLISLFRLLLIPLMVGLYFKAKTVAALCVFALSAVSDVVDGQIARRFDMVTDLGKMLDPLADKLTQGAAAVCVARSHPRLFLLFGLMAAKELTQAAIGAHAVKTTGQVFSSMWFGKACTVCITACLMVMFAFPQLPERAINGMMIFCSALLIVSLALYIDFFHKRNAAAEQREDAVS